MRADLQDLVITEKSFNEVTGVEISELQDLSTSEKIRGYKKFVRFLFRPWIYLCLFILFSSIILLPLVWVISQCLGIVFVDLRLTWSSALKTAAYISIPLSVLLTFITLSERKQRKKLLIHLRPLFDEFERYNQVIQAIAIKDQLEEIEFGKAESERREPVLHTLKEMKEDLIRALKVERILRENKNIVDLNPEIFESSFTALRVEKINAQGSEYSQLIDETLKIGMNVRSEMNKMKKRSN